MGIISTISKLYSNALLNGVARINTGPAIHISSNGTSTVSSEELERIVLRRFKEMSVANHATPTGSDPTDPE
jgi:hypothetical protein